MLISDTIRLFLDSIGRSEEYEYYLKKFRSDRSSCFAVLAPDAAACQQGGENLDVALQYLERLDLIPAVLLSGPQAEAMLVQLPRANQESGGYAVFRPATAVPTEAYGAAVETATAGQDVALNIELGAAVQSALARKTSLVIVWPEASFARALEYLSRQLSARLYLVRMAGALRDRTGAPLLYYHYRSEHSRTDLAPEDGALAGLATGIAESSDRASRGANRLHMSVTAPYSLLKEIFTVKGAGTMIRAGSNIEHYDSAAALGTAGRERLLKLLGYSFGKALADDSFLERAGAIYIEANYQGAIILERQPMGDYLSKFAVDKQARGIGIAQELWDLVIREHPQLFWRSRSHNSINRWYSSLADGTVRAEPHWQVFWRGVALDDLPRIIRYCVDRPEDFVSPGSGQSSGPV